MTSSCAGEYRILIVDDTLINRRVLERMLIRIGVSQVTAVESGTLALQHLDRNDDNFNLVITDLQMPNDMSGTELSAAIRKREGPLVIGLTADTSSEVDKSCRESGMVDVLHKPITVTELHDYFENVVKTLTTRPMI